MDDSVLWAVALASGAFGLLLLAVGGVVAVYLNTGARGTRDVASADRAQSNAGDVASADKTRSRADSSNAKRTTTKSSWTWIKAWVFALVHAGTVSLVLGGITLFEDLAKASDEIQRTGTVTFPKQLLPGTLSGSASRKRLSQPSRDSPRNDHHRSDDHQRKATDDGVEFEDSDRSGASSSDGMMWEVVDLVNEAGVGGGD